MPRGFEGDWVSRVIRTLMEAKTYGVTFDQAWKVAMAKHPPHQWARGPAHPTLEDAGEVCVADFLHDCCRDAWHGDKPELRHLTMSLLLDPEVIAAQKTQHFEVIA